MEDDQLFKHRNYTIGTAQQLTIKTNRLLSQARSLANRSSYGKIRHGAVLVKGGTIINSSYNKDKFSSFGNRFRRQGLGPATHHAELGCILGVDKSKTTGATVYVVRINKLGQYRLSKPCPMCHEILKFCGVKKVVYTKNEHEIESYKL